MVLSRPLGPGWVLHEVSVAGLTLPLTARPGYTGLFTLDHVPALSWPTT